jgi:hypothetical protein
VVHPALADVATCFNRLEPAQVLDCFVRTLIAFPTASSMEAGKVPVSSISL